MLQAFQHFLLIAEHGTFTAAAKHAHLSQPALTASIRKLEDELDTTLFHRGRRGAQLTASGTALVPKARAALAAVEASRRAVHEVMDLSRGEVRIGAGATVCTYLLPQSLAAFRSQYPGIRFFLREMTTDEALNGLAEGHLDLAIVTTDRGEPWLTDELVLVAAPETDAKQSPHVNFRQPSTSRDLLNRYFPDADVVMELGSVAAVKAYVRAGVGIALISRQSMVTDLKLGRLVEVQHERTPIHRPLRIVHEESVPLAPAAEALRHFLLTHPPTFIDPEVQLPPRRQGQTQL